MRLLLGDAVCCDRASRILSVGRSKHCRVKGTGFYFPFDVTEDKIDLFIFMLYRCPTNLELDGVFIFPSSYLQDQGVLSSENAKGRLGMVLYPPGATGVSKTREELVAKQQSYHISFKEDDKKENFLQNHPEVDSMEKQKTEKLASLLLGK
ncbi:unnamed protein product [Amoebophrya sp. A25]|nr:unnamed protein product [Amoebophrya sp. A25]|eukprot:GSA25T00009147001.1